MKDGIFKNVTIYNSISIDDPTDHFHEFSELCKNEGFELRVRNTCFSNGLEFLITKDVARPSEHITHCYSYIVFPQSFAYGDVDFMVIFKKILEDAKNEFEKLEKEGAKNIDSLMGFNKASEEPHHESFGNTIPRTFWKEEKTIANLW